MAVQKITQNIALHKPTDMVKQKAQEAIQPKIAKSSMMKSFNEAKKGFNIDRKA